jgi:hypothetical protein
VSRQALLETVRAPQSVRLPRWGELRHWDLGSSVGSRRNALVASTALAERRRDLDEVEDYLRRLPAEAALDSRLR